MRVVCIEVANSGEPVLVGLCAVDQIAIVNPVEGERLNRSNSAHAIGEAFFPQVFDGAFALRRTERLISGLVAFFVG